MCSQQSENCQNVNINTRFCICHIQDNAIHEMCTLFFGLFQFAVVAVVCSLHISSFKCFAVKCLTLFEVILFAISYLTYKIICSCNICVIQFSLYLLSIAFWNHMLGILWVNRNAEKWKNIANVCVCVCLCDYSKIFTYNCGGEFNFKTCYMLRPIFFEIYLHIYGASLFAGICFSICLSLLLTHSLLLECLSFMWKSLRI